MGVTNHFGMKEINKQNMDMSNPLNQVNIISIWLLLSIFLK